MRKTFSTGSCPVELNDQTPRRESAPFSSGFDGMDVNFIGTLPQQPMRENRGDDPGRCK